jgi:Fe-S cluster assembly iron-binding protein IscA
VSDKSQSREAIKRAGRKFEDRLAQAIKDRESGALTLRIKVDRGKAQDIQVTFHFDEPVKGFDVSGEENVAED